MGTDEGCGNAEERENAAPSSCAAALTIVPTFATSFNLSCFMPWTTSLRVLFRTIWRTSRSLSATLCNDTNACRRKKAAGCFWNEMKNRLDSQCRWRAFPLVKAEYTF